MKKEKILGNMLDWKRREKPTLHQSCNVCKIARPMEIGSLAVCLWCNELVKIANGTGLRLRPHIMRKIQRARRVGK